MMRVIMTDERREHPTGTATAAELLRELRASQGTTLHEYRHLHAVPTGTGGPPTPHGSRTPGYGPTPGRA